MNEQMRQFLFDNFFSLVKPFPVLWQEWECDGTWYLCTDSTGKHVFVLTEYGKPYVGTSKEVKERLNYYREVIRETEEVLELAKDLE